MPRGFTLCQYVDDFGTPWRLMVDADYALDTDRGWVAASSPGLYPLPRGWDPRHVVGMVDDGTIAMARIGRLDAPLWTGAVSQFWFSANDGTTKWATVITRLDEHRRH